MGGLQRPSMSWLRSPVSMPACTPACVLVPGLPCPPPGFRPQLTGLSSLRHADMPSQHQGYVRRQPVPCRAGSRSSGPWKRAHILVDSGSQQPPLISMEFASTLGVTTGPSRTGAAQAGGAAIPIYDVGPLQLAVNGAPSTEMFCAAPITPYDVILGESWLLKHGGILDYTRCQLGRRGVLDGDFQLLDLSHSPTLMPDVNLRTSGDASAREGVMYSLTSTARPGIVPVALPAWLASWSSVSESAEVDGRRGGAGVLGDG